MAVIGLVDELEEIYAAAVKAIRDGLACYLRHGQLPDPDQRSRGLYAYPELVLTWHAATRAPRPSRAFGLIRNPGTYTVTVTRPNLFRAYLIEQLNLLEADYNIEAHVRRSSVEIPYPYVLDGSDDLMLDSSPLDSLGRVFPTASLALIADDVVDGVRNRTRDGHWPLALFDAPRVDFSLARLRHYTGTSPEHFQRFILFTNYSRYVGEFVRWGEQALRGGETYTELVLPGGASITGGAPEGASASSDPFAQRFQMPAYHLKAPDNLGLTMVNIGVGPSNAKTITDHLAVLRPEAWLMIGHCGGLRPSQTIGDYVLAHAYLRDDHVLDDVLPVEIPIPPIAEVQQALFSAAETVTGQAGDALKPRLRTGTVVTTDDRNWELRFTSSALRFNQSRAVGIDMESATIAAQGYRFRVPYGTLLCVSDKPLHGEIKLPGQANRFYDQAVSEHLYIGIEAVNRLRREGSHLHSRKLRAFDEPPFR